jgi:hypothetical protein
MVGVIPGSIAPSMGRLFPAHRALEMIRRFKLITYLTILRLAP